MLTNLADATLGEVMWVWKAFFPNDEVGDVSHIYQFGLRHQSHWQIASDGVEPFPDAQPLCGAPAFERGSHNHITSGAGKTTQCTWCLVRLVSDYPHLFMKGGI